VICDVPVTIGFDKMASRANKVAVVGLQPLKKQAMSVLRKVARWGKAIGDLVTDSLIACYAKKERAFSIAAARAILEENQSKLVFNNRH
jgi:hypothetical protein